MPQLVVVTPNPAIDITYEVPRPRLGEVHRVSSIVRRAGGKGLNVAAVLGQLGLRSRVTGFLGGRGGAELRELVQDWTVDQDWVELGPTYPTRSSVAVRAQDGSVTVFNEAGPTVDATAWAQLTQTVMAVLRADDVLVVSGSCPPGTTTEDLATLLQAACERGARTVLDTSGPLLVACAGLVDAVKPNREELAQATGTQDLGAGAKTLLQQGTGAVVVSDGPRGMYLFAGGSAGQAWHAAAPEVKVVNPTGAGDSVVAALAAALHRDPTGLTGDTLEEAVALSVAAVVTPVAGVVDLPTYQRLRGRVTVEPVT
ncbi:1-phosphofructokinase family hexose kinase [Actinomyces bovis]|nr:1-phosphofructokinase family hexose kinase [Actinomyces bovis]